MPSEVDPELLVDAILMHVDDLGAGGPAWLRGEFDRVLQATMDGDEFVTGTSYKGQSSNAERMVPAAELLALLTQARRRLPNADGHITSPAAGAMLIPRLSGFIS